MGGEGSPARRERQHHLNGPRPEVPPAISSGCPRVPAPPPCRVRSVARRDRDIVFWCHNNNNNNSSRLNRSSPPAISTPMPNRPRRRAAMIPWTHRPFKRRKCRHPTRRRAKDDAGRFMSTRRGCPMNSLSIQVKKRIFYGFISNECLINWLIGWLIACLIDWLIDPFELE